MSTDNAQNADSSTVLGAGDPRPDSIIVRLGEVLNGLRYFAEVAWITNELGDPAEFTRLWSEAKIHARELFGAEVRHPRIQSYIDEISEEWSRNFQSERHQDDLNSANAMIVASQERGWDLPDGETPQEFYCRVANEGGRSIRSLTNKFRDALTEELRIHLDLGVHRNQRDHPPLTRHTVEFQVQQQSSSVEGANVWTTVVPRPTWRMPTAPPTLRENWPSEDWLRQLEHMEVLTASRPIAVEGHLPLATDAQAELGLVLDPVESSVSRHGQSTQIRLERRFYRLLSLLLNQPGQTVPWLMSHWDQVGRDPTSSRSTVDDAIVDLNSELLRLGLEVSSDVDLRKYVRSIQPPGNTSN